ncbi:response regulator [bacterium]|nr:response regulator [bacterium]
MSSQVRILVLEDDSIMLELLCEALEGAGYEARGAGRPELAVEMARKIPFELVISDIRMAGPTDGLGAIAAIKKFQPGVKVVMITGYASDDCPRRAIELQVDDYVHKPFRVPAMLEVVRRTLNRRSGILAPLQGLRNLFTAPLRLMEKTSVKRVQQLVVLLEQEKQRVLQGFFVALRSKSISKSAALDTWDQLERLEAHSARLTDQPTEAAVQSVGSAYRKIYERIGYFEKTGHVASSAPRQPGQVSRPGFGVVVDRVQSGQVGLEELVQLLLVRCEPRRQSELSPPLQELYRGLSG